MATSDDDNDAQNSSAEKKALLIGKVIFIHDLIWSTALEKRKGK